MTREIRIQTLRGKPFERGVQHGEAYRADIRRYAEDRIGLVAGGRWTGSYQPSRSEILTLAQACIPFHEVYAPDLMDELLGMAQATSLTLAELIVVGGFTDFVDTVYGTFNMHGALPSELAIDDCTAFIVPDHRANGAGFFGQTWDMHATATEFVVLLQVEPDDGPKSLVFTTTGCVGQIGMNEHGVSVGINNLLGADGRVGLTWPFVVRKVLQQDNVDDALACITSAPLAGAHNYLLFDKTGKGYNVEAMATQYHITPLEDEPIAHTNHCLLPENDALAQQRPPELQANTESRLSLAETCLAQSPITIEQLQDLTRQPPVCQKAQPPYHVDSCGAAIMRPKTGDFWAVWGRPDENAYTRFQI